MEGAAVRRARVLLVAAFLFTAPAGLRAQRGTADALVALSREDYQTAADILRPIAEASDADDPAAQFLLATLYETGRAVPQDRLRACALYFRAAGHDASPFASQARRMMYALVRSGREGFFGDCGLVGQVGVDHRLDPVRFDLGPGHSVTWDLKGATIEYQGKTTEVERRLAIRADAFLPLQHTVLRTGPRSDIARHYIEVMVWRRAQANTYALHWHLFEVAGNRVVTVADQPDLLRRHGRPPADHTLDIRTLIALRVNSNGDPEWQLLPRKTP
jgi:hypothetical protein